LFEFDDAIRAGSTAARRSVVERGLAYLDRLAQTRTDAGLTREVIAGYCRVGDLQGNMFYPNLGDAKGAAASYRRAQELLSRLAASPETDKVAALVEQKLGELAIGAGHRPEALDHFRRALALLSNSASARSLIE